MIDSVQPRRVLVTGGLGFLGSALVRALVARGDTVRVLDDASRGRLHRLSGVEDRVEIREADVRDAAPVADACAGMDLVCHLAFVNGTEFFYSMPETVLDVGIRGMLAVIDGCRTTGVRELLLMSSSEVYQTPPVIPTPEDVPLVIPDARNPRYSYAAGKIISEMMAIHYARGTFDRVLIVRPHNVYGPDMGWEHVVPQLSVRLGRLAVASPPGPIELPIQGDGSETRAFVHVEDFTDGVMAVLDRGSHLTTYHVGTDEEVSIADLARLIGKLQGREVRLVPGPPPSGATPRRCPDITRARSLGYQPRIPLEAGLRDSVSWYLSHLDQAPERPT